MSKKKSEKGKRCDYPQQTQHSALRWFNKQSKFCNFELDLWLYLAPLLFSVLQVNTVFIIFESILGKNKATVEIHTKSKFYFQPMHTSICT